MIQLVLIQLLELVKKKPTIGIAGSIGGVLLSVSVDDVTQGLQIMSLSAGFTLAALTIYLKVRDELRKKKSVREQSNNDSDV